MSIPVIFGPSLGCTSRNLWQPTLSLLPENRHSVIFDLPGHDADGLATVSSIRRLAEQVINLADQARIDRFHYAGVSIGGVIGWELALEWPARLASLALLCSTPRIGTADSWQQRVVEIRKAGLVALAPSLAPRWFGPDFTVAHPEQVTIATDCLTRVDERDYLQLCEALGNYDRWVAAPQMQSPLLAVVGSADPVIPVVDIERLARSVPNGAAATLLGVGHLPPWEAPVATANLLNAHWAANS